MKIAVFIVTYPAAAPYFTECLASLDAQTDKDFSLVIANDGLDDLDSFLGEFNFDVNVINCHGSPAAIRRQGLSSLIASDFDWAVLLDADDYASNDRIAKLRPHMNTDCDVLFHELQIFDDHKHQAHPMLRGLFSAETNLTWNHICNGNALGMTNTAIACNQLTPTLERIPDDIVAYDWALFSDLILRDKRARLVESTATYYRQHASNSALSKELTNNFLSRGVKVKAQHYSFLANRYTVAETRAKEFAKVERKIESDPNWTAKYFEALRTTPNENQLWWSVIRRPGDVNIENW